MAQVPEHEKKKAAATAKIEDGFRPAPMQSKILGALDVEPQPAPDISVLRVMLGRASVLLLDRSQFCLIDLGIDRLERDGMNHPLRASPGAPIRQRLAELCNFMGKIHPIGRIATIQSAPATGKRTRRLGLTAA